jgi:hypothetical protein
MSTIQGAVAALPAAVVEAVAEQMHEANRAWCVANGDDSQKSWAAAPDWQKDATYANIHGIFANPTFDPTESHRRWYDKKKADDWKHGPVKDEAKKEHPDMVPYEQLSPVARAKDSITSGVALGARAALVAVGLLPA